MLWRALLGIGGVLVVAGAMGHPRAPTLADMLAHPDWVLSHSLMTAGFLAWIFAILLWRRAIAAPERTRRWTLWMIVATMLQMVEAVLHTAAVVDAERAAAATSLFSMDTPVLSAHLALAVAVYPIFGAVTIGWLIATARDRTLGSPWIQWLGVLGALAHGLSAPLVLIAQIPGAWILFPMLMLLAIWAVLAAVWPVRGTAPA